MPISTSINSATLGLNSSVNGTGEFLATIIPPTIRRSQNDTTPFKVTGISSYINGRNSAVSVSLGVESSSSAFFEVPQGSVSTISQNDTGLKEISYTFLTAPPVFDMNIYANGSINVGTGNVTGTTISVNGILVATNRSPVGRYEYVQVPASPQISAIDNITSSSMRINFVPSDDTGGGSIAGYQVQLATSPDFSSGLRVYNTTDLSYTATSLSAGRTYYARVLTKNELWAEAQSAGSPWSTTVAAGTLLEAAASGAGNEAFFRYTEPSKSNLYAEKVYSEHPLVLWPLDDRADYLSMISEGFRDLSTWDVTNGVAEKNVLESAVNVFTNPSFETAGTQEILKKNLIKNPSFEADAGVTEIWRNIYPNPTFSEGSTLSTFTELRRNYVTNPNFETNTTGWTGTPAVTRQTSQIWSGTASGQVAWTAVNQFIESNQISLYEDEIFTISAWVRMTAGRQITIGANFRDGNTGSVMYAAESSTITGTGSWQRVSYTFTAPIEMPTQSFFEGTFTVQLKNKTSGANTIQIDGVLAERGSILKPYFDGSSYGTGSGDSDHTLAWTGTVNNSASTVSGRDLNNVASLFIGKAVGYSSSQWGLATTSPSPASQSLRISPTYSNDSFVNLNGIVLKATTTYTVLGTIRLTAQQSNPSSYARKFRAIAGGQEIAFNYLSEAPNSVGVHQVRATFETTSDVSSLDFRIYNGDDTADVWWDNVNIVEGVYLGNYFDGRTSPDSDLIPSFESVSGNTNSILKGLVPLGIDFTAENGRAILSSSWSSTGTKSLKLISTSRIEPARYYATLGSLGLEVGKTYTVKLKARLASPQSGTLYEFPSVSPLFPFYKKDNIAGVEEGEITFNIDGTTVTLDDELSIYNRATVGNGDVWFDDFLLIEGDATNEYFSGSSISTNPDIQISWQGTPNNSYSVQTLTTVAGVTNGYQSSAWANLGQYSLKVFDDETATVTIAEESTVIITAKDAGQEIITNNGTDVSTEPNQTITIYGVTSLELGTGYWDNLCIVAGSYTLGYFDGSNDVPGYYSTAWSGSENNSTSVATPITNKIYSIGAAEPFTSSLTTVIKASTGQSTVTCLSPVFASPVDISTFLSSMSIGMYIAADNNNVSSVDIGYTDGTNEYTQNFRVDLANQWLYVASQFSSVSTSGQYQAILKVNFRDTSIDTNVIVNGLSIGQWSEEFQLTSLGATRIEIPAEVGVGDFYGVLAEAYGLQDSNGYYVINDNMLLARNSGMPMVYGSNNITTIYPHPDSGPSMLLPGFGFLNDVGRYRDYTVEFWCRISADTTGPRRIFGPTTSEDGLYVDGPFLTLKVGDNIASHYISEWYRPMLIDIVYGKTVVRLLVDGEVVASMPIVAASLDLPLDTLNDIDQDWLAFYAYEDVPQIDVDAFSIYSYQVPQLVAKRRFVYGQGVEFPETINNAYNGKSILIDNTYAEYTNSYRYPDIGKWIQGVSENVSVTENALATPEYALPQVVFNKQTTESWYEDLSAIEDDLLDEITMKPNSSWADIDGYMLFDSLNIVKQDIKGFYGVFNVGEDQINNEVLFKIEDDATKNYLLITITGNMFDGYTVDYTVRYGPNTEPEIVFSDYVLTTNETIYAGIDIDKFARKYGRNLSSFFGSPRKLKVYVAGTKEFQNTFSGRISSIGFCTRRNFSKIAHLFDASGIAIPEIYDAGDEYFGNDPLYWDQTIDGGQPSSIYFESALKNHVASYTLFAKKYYGKFMLDIATDSYWEDYIPLTYFGKKVLDSDGDYRYGLEFIQFNVDYPRPLKKVNGFYDTSDSLLKTYVSFQYISTGANQTPASFNEIIPASDNGVLEPGTSWINKKFEVVNNTVIYPPEGVDFTKMAIVVHIEFQTNGVLTQPVRLRNLHLSSKSWNANQPNKIGTRLGQPIYPYTKRGIYFDYQAKNPYALYRGSTPYLYLTKDSGIKLVGNVNMTFNRGLSMTVNQDRASRFRLTAVQAAMYFPDDSFPTLPTPVFEIDANTSTIEFYMVSTHINNRRATIYAVDKSTGREFTDALFFLNGRFVKNPTISLNEWNMLGVAFMNNIALDGKAGAIRINGPMMFNNFSFYEETALQQARQASLRQWLGVKYSGDTELPWDIWNEYDWEYVLTLSPNDYDGVNPVDLYTTYSGTNKIVVGDDTSMRIGSYKYKVYQDVVSTPYTIKPL